MKSNKPAPVTQEAAALSHGCVLEVRAFALFAELFQLQNDHVLSYKGYASNFLNFITHYGSVT